MTLRCWTSPGRPGLPQAQVRLAGEPVVYNPTMPTVLRVNGHRFFFFSSDWREPPYIHVEKGAGYAKFWLEPVALARCRGFRSHELTEIGRLVAQYAALFREKWDEHFSA